MPHLSSTSKLAALGCLVVAGGLLVLPARGQEAAGTATSEPQASAGAYEAGLATGTIVAKRFDCEPGAKAEIKAKLNTTQAEFMNLQCICSPDKAVATNKAKQYVVYLNNGELSKARQLANVHYITKITEEGAPEKPNTLYCYKTSDLEALAK